MFSQSLASYPLLGCVVSAAQFAGGELSFYETSLQLLAEDGCGQWTTTLTLSYDCLIHLRVVREKGFMRISTLRAPVVRWAEDNGFTSQLDADDIDDIDNGNKDNNEGNAAVSSGGSLEKQVHFVPPLSSSAGRECVLLFQLSRDDMASFMANVAPLVAARERMRSASRISITEPLPVGCPFEDPSGGLGEENSSNIDEDNNSNEYSSENQKTLHQADETTLLEGAERVKRPVSETEKGASLTRSQYENTIRTELFPSEIKNNKKNKERTLDDTLSDQLAQFEEEAVQARGEGLSGKLLRASRALGATGNPSLRRVSSRANGGPRGFNDLSAFDGRKKNKKHAKESSFAQHASVGASTTVSIHSTAAAPARRTRRKKGLYLPSEGQESVEKNLNSHDRVLEAGVGKKNDFNKVDSPPERASRNTANLLPSIATVGGGESHERGSLHRRELHQDATLPAQGVESVDGRTDVKSLTHHEVASSLCIGDIVLEQNSFHGTALQKPRNPQGDNSLSKQKLPPPTTCETKPASHFASSENPQPTTTNPRSMDGFKKGACNVNPDVEKAPGAAYNFSDIMTLPQDAAELPLPPPPIPSASAISNRTRRQVSSAMDGLGEILACLTTRGRRKGGKRADNARTATKRRKTERIASPPPPSQTPLPVEAVYPCSPVKTPQQRPFPLLLLDDEEVPCGQPPPDRPLESPSQSSSRRANTKRTENINKGNKEEEEGGNGDRGAGDGAEEGSPGEGAGAASASLQSKPLDTASFCAENKNNALEEENEKEDGEEEAAVKLEGAYPINKSPSEGGLPSDPYLDSAFSPMNLPHAEPLEQGPSPTVNKIAVIKTANDNDDIFLMEEAHKNLRKERLRRVMRCMNFISRHLNLMRESEAELRGIVLSLMDDGQI